MDNTVLSKIIDIFATPVGLILGALAALWVQLIRINGNKTIAAKLSIGTEALTQAKLICNLAVSAAQQKYKAGQISDRKSFALEWAKQTRDDNNVPVTDESIDTIIEAQKWDTQSGPAEVAAILANNPKPTPAPVPPSLGDIPG